MIGNETDRAEEVYRRWRRTSLDVMRQASWTGWNREDAGFMSGMGSGILLLLLEPSLWLQGWPPWSFGSRAAVWLSLFSIFALPFHGFLLDRFLSAKTPEERSLPRWLLALRFAAACIPLFSFVLIPAWKRLLERRPTWIHSRPRPALDLFRNPDRPAVPGRLLRLYTSGFFAFYLPLAFAVPILWALWLAQTGTLGTARIPITIGICGLLHLAAFAGTRVYLAVWQPRSTVLTKLAPWLCLFPLPLPFIALVGPDLLAVDRDGAHPLAWSAWASRSESARLPLWRSMERALRQRGSAAPRLARWQRPRRIDQDVHAGGHERALLSFYRGKTALLLLETPALLAVLTSLVRRFPGLGPAINLMARAAIYAGIALAALGLLILAGTAIARVLGLRARPSLAVSGRYLLLTQLAFLAGTQAGSLWLAGQLKELGLLIAYGGALLAIFGWMFFLPSRYKVSRTSLSWLLSFLLLCLCGVPVGLNERLHGWPAHVLAGATLLTPLWSLLLFRRFSTWLPRPLMWRDIRNGQVPRRTRAALIFLGIIAAAPGGGLAIPIWIALRAALLRPGLSPATPP